MRVKIAVKAPSKRKVEFTDYFLDSRPGTLRELIVAIVTRQVEEFNAKRRGLGDVEDVGEVSDELERLKVLDERSLWNMSKEGKIAFGEIYARKEQDVGEAAENALISFGDGLFATFIDGKQAEKLDEAIDLHEDSEITFIRLTFLAGRMW